MTATPTPPSAPPDPALQRGWEGLLDPDEHVLWQGRPVPGFTMAPFSLFKSLFGLAFAGFAVFWMSAASWITRGGPEGPFALFPLFGLPFLLVGLWMAVGYALWGTWARRFTTYTLTTRRAFIARDLPLFGKSLKGWPIRPDTPLDYDGGDPGTIYFAERVVRGQRGTTTTVPVGFIRIADPRRVYGHLRAIQRGET